MTEYSYNGWIAARNSSEIPGGIQPLVIGESSFRPGVRAGDVHTVFSYFMTEFDARVETLELYEEGDEWGYNYRKNRNANNLSCHASATAADANATKHPNGKRNTFSKKAVAEIRKIQEEVNWVIKWGGDFSGTPDEMHFEIHGTIAQVAAVARRLRERADDKRVAPAVHEIKSGETANAAIGSVLEFGAQGPEVLWWQQELWRLGYGVGLHDSIFGPAVADATRDFQIAAGITLDGRVGPQSRAIASTVPTYPKPSGPELLLAQPHGNSDTVRAFQQALKDRGWDIAVDGDYGPKTARIIGLFQAEKGLGADGVGGPSTWTALYTRAR